MLELVLLSQKKTFYGQALFSEEAEVFQHVPQNSSVYSEEDVVF